MSHALASSLSVAVILGLVACTTTVEPSKPVTVRTVSATLDRPSGTVATVPYIVANDGAVPIRLIGSCGDDPAARVERQAGHGWVPYAGGVCLATQLAGLLLLPPGAARQGTVSLTEAGDYRLRMLTERGDVVSATFHVR